MPHSVYIPLYQDSEDLFLNRLPLIIANTLTAEKFVLLDFEDHFSNIDNIGQSSANRCTFHYVNLTNQAHHPESLLWPVIDYLRSQLSINSDTMNNDVLYVHPKVIVPYGWDARLALEVDKNPAIAVVSPLCNYADLFAILNHATHIDPIQIDQWVYMLSQRCVHQIPTILPYCFYLSSRTFTLIQSELEQITGTTDEELCWNLAQLFSRKGWVTVLCDHIYITTSDNQIAQITANNMGYADIKAINAVHPLTGLRYAVQDALNQNIPSVDISAIKPAQLHIVHSWGGGIERWLQDYCEADHQRTNLILRSIGVIGHYGQRIALYRSPMMDQPIRYWELSYPIRAIIPSHLEYRRLLQEIIAQWGIEAIIVSSLIGHSLDALDTHLPTVLITHDYLPFCPALNIYFEKICTTCQTEQLKHCFDRNPYNRFFYPMTTTEWLGIRYRFEQLLYRENLTLVSPSNSVPRHLQVLLPTIKDRTFHIIPHGISLSNEYQHQPLDNEQRDTHQSPDLNSKLNIVILGHLSLQKGQRLFAEIYPSVIEIADFYLIGCGEAGGLFKNKRGLVIIEQYEHQKLPEIIQNIQPDLGLLLSVVPETFSYTLSELLFLKVPVLATQVGSFVDRIQEGVNGFLCPPTPAALTDKIIWIAHHREALHFIKQHLSTERPRTTQDMVADYHQLTPLPIFSKSRYLAQQLNPASSTTTKPSVIYIHPTARFSQVFCEFIHYALNKLKTTPRLSTWQKNIILCLLKPLLKWVSK